MFSALNNNIDGFRLRLNFFGALGTEKKKIFLSNLVFLLTCTRKLIEIRPPRKFKISFSQKTKKDLK
jgi:hypothetical protein